MTAKQISKLGFFEDKKKKIDPMPAMSGMWPVDISMMPHFPTGLSEKNPAERSDF